MSVFLQRIVEFMCDPVSQWFYVFWVLWFMSGNVKAMWQGDWSYWHMIQGFHAAFWSFAGMFGAWFTIHSKAVLYPGSSAAAFVFTGGVLGGLAYQTYSNITWLIGLPPKYRRIGREPVVQVTANTVRADLGTDPPTQVTATTTVSVASAEENKQEEPNHG